MEAIMRLTPKQAAEHLGCSVSIVYSLCENKRLPHYRLGNKRGKILIETSDLDQFMEGCRIGNARVNAPVQPILKLKHLKL